MADMSDLHPAVVHALRTGNIDQARAAAAARGADSTARTTRTSRTEPSRRPSNPQSRPTVAEDDEFYEQFNNDPLGRR
ncbi:Uncharacterised protein [Mycobacteroides abscessus subsp. abscessus]|nr:Uncharacterised protein [Mycobacteroides abscessus subsp. abscessus]